MQETREKEAGKQKISNITDLITNFLTLQKRESQTEITLPQNVSKRI